MTHQEEIAVESRGHGHVQDLTGQVAEVVRRSGIAVGVAHVFNVGSTAAVAAMEFEPGLCRDLPAALDRLAPPGRDYEHEKAWHDGNGHSHVQASLLGPSLCIPVRGGELVLGSWQQVVHVECDVRARRRAVVVTVTGERAG